MSCSKFEYEFDVKGDLDDRGYASQFANSAWELSKASLIMAREEKYCNLYRTTLRSSNNNMTSSLDSSTKGVWCWHHGHVKVNIKGKKGDLHIGFSRGKTYDVKEKIMQEGENSLHKFKVRG